VFWRNYTDSGYDEGAHLCFDDITINSLQSPKVLKVHLKASKTDPFCVGVDVFVGATNHGLCPVAAVLAYLTMRGHGAGPFFHFEDGTTDKSMLCIWSEGGSGSSRGGSVSIFWA
jgi:hypothetical protein